MQLEFFSLQRGDEGFDQQNALRRFSRCGDLEFVGAMRLIFRRPFSEQPANRFTNLEFGLRPRAVAIGKALPAEVLDDRRVGVGVERAGRGLGHA